MIFTHCLVCGMLIRLERQPSGSEVPVCSAQCIQSVESGTFHRNAKLGTLHRIKRLAAADDRDQA